MAQPLRVVRQWSLRRALLCTCRNTYARGSFPPTLMLFSIFSTDFWEIVGMVKYKATAEEKQEGSKLEKYSCLCVIQAFQLALLEIQVLDLAMKMHVTESFERIWVHEFCQDPQRKDPLITPVKNLCRKGFNTVLHLISITNTLLLHCWEFHHCRFPAPDPGLLLCCKNDTVVHSCSIGLVFAHP